MDAEAAAAMIAAFAALMALLFAAKSAGAAHRSALQAEAVAQIEREHRHDLLNPEGPAPLNFQLKIGTVVGREHLIGVFQLSRAYRVQAVLYPHDREPESRDLGLVSAHQREFIPIEKHPPPSIADCPSITAIRLQFWPPDPEDDTGHWSCMCGRPEAYMPGEPGHWEVRIAIPAVPVTARTDPDIGYQISYDMRGD